MKSSMQRKDLIIVNRPNDTSLPFFAYGLYKPGQLCFSRISDIVEKTVECSVEGHLKERDGIPLLVLGRNCPSIKGYLIYFDAGKESEAYDRIVGIEPDEVYRWGTIKINDSRANALIGKRELRGSSDFENFEEWDGRTDPFFKQGIEEVESILKANSSFDWEFRALLRLQMAYTLLWSAIERYAGLKYHLGKKANEKVYQIAAEKSFIDGLETNVQKRREVFSTTDLTKYTLDPSDPDKSIRYYYQVRSNAIHRGKAVKRDFDTIRNSLEELLAIFKEMLNEAFRQERR